MKCPKCNRGLLRMKVNIFADVRADCRCLSKKGIKSNDVVIEGVGWDQATFYCTDAECGYLLRLKGPAK